jgi:hypothetical protein
MTSTIRFNYRLAPNQPASLMPRLTLMLHSAEFTVEATGLLDTGAAVNVLPFETGVALGLDWHAQETPVPLVGSLGSFQARAVKVWASHPQLTPNGPIELVFAWTEARNAPLLFGQVNFFQEFNVCFYRTQEFFEIHLPTQLG